MKKLLIKTGTYQKDGQTKNRYTQLGVIKQGQDGGEYALLDPTVNLAGCLIQQNGIDPSAPQRTNVMVSIFEQDNQRTAQSAPQAQQAQTMTAPPVPQPQSNESFADDIPF